MLAYYIFSSIYTYTRFILYLKEDNNYNLSNVVFYLIVSLLLGIVLFPIDVAKIFHEKLNS
jgi:hypothetical protein